jgi:FkbM family methyltransferase
MSQRFVQRILDRGQRIVASSDLGVRLAVAIRNQCRCVIKYRLAESPDAVETGERWLVERVARFGTRFVDVGANVGDWLGLLLSACGERSVEALAFEPSASAFAALSQRYAREPRVTLANDALGSEPGALPFFEERAAGKGSSFVADFLRAEGAAREVAVKRLDRELVERGWETVDLVKVDAEGYDLQVLRGAGTFVERAAIGVVQFEYNRAWQLAGDTLRSAYKLLEPAGYRVFVLKRDGLYTLDYARYEEYFEYTNYVAISPNAMRHFDDRLRGSI